MRPFQKHQRILQEISETESRSLLILLSCFSRFCKDLAFLSYEQKKPEWPLKHINVNIQMREIKYEQKRLTTFVIGSPASPLLSKRCDDQPCIARAAESLRALLEPGA